LSDRKRERLSHRPLVVVNAISWHDGIPFYEVGVINELSPVSYVAEFYLQELEQ